MNDPIKKTVTVPLSAAEAFELFTTEIDSWWPKDLFSVKGDGSKISFPKRKGGDIVEHAEDGEEHVWGSIIAYEPGVYVAFTWFPGRDASQATVVEMRFAQTEAGTRCDLTHGGFDILGPTADAVSTSYLRGWDLVLGCFATAIKNPVMA